MNFLPIAASVLLSLSFFLSVMPAPGHCEPANGAAGYIPPPEQHFLGGYTTWPARTAGLEVDAKPKIVETLLQMLEKFSGKKRRPLTVDFYNDQQRKAIQEAKDDHNNRANRGLDYEKH